MPSRREREHEELMRLRRESPARPTISWEEMIPCPTCKVPRAVARGPFPLEKNLTAQGYYVECRNKGRCRQADLPPFFVEVLSDGTIPIRMPGPKDYDAPLLSKEQQSQIDAYFQAQYDATREGRELRKD
jgi:hypothetical protein